MAKQTLISILLTIGLPMLLRGQTEPTVATCEGDQYVCINSAYFDLCVVIDPSDFNLPIDNFVITWDDGQTTTVPAGGPLTQTHTYDLSNFYLTNQAETEFTIKLCTHVVGDPDPVCTATFITFLNPPVAQFTTSSPECVGGQPVTLNNTSFPTQGLTSCPWDYGDGTTGTQNNHLYSQAGTYNVTLKVFNQCDTVTVTHPVEVLNLPEAHATAVSGVLDASADTLIVCLEGGGIVSLNGETYSLHETTYKWRVISPNSGYAWIPPTPNMPIVPNPQIDFNAVGLYRVELRVDNPCQQPDLDTLLFRVTRKPNIGLMLNAVACQPMTVTLNSFDSLDVGDYPFDSCHWSFGGVPANTTDCDPGSLTFSQSTTIVFTACNACGCTSDTGTVTIVPSTVAHINPPADTVVCSNEPPLQLSVAPPTQGGIWRINGVIVSSGVFNADLPPAQPGLNLVTYGNPPCVEPDTLYLFVVPTGVSFSNPPDMACIYDPPISLNVQPPGAILSGNGVNAAAATFSPALAGAGSHTVTATYQDDNMLCPVSTETIEIEVIALQAAFEVTGCDELSISFATTPTTSLFASILWNFGDGSTSTQPAPTHEYAAPGTYTVTVTISRDGCTASFSAPVTIEMPPNALFQLDYASPACGPLAVTVTNLSTGDNLNYQWNIGGQTVNGQDPGPVLLNNTALISLTVSNGCGSSVHDSMVVVAPTPVAEFGVNAYVCSGEILEIYNVAMLYDELFWDFGNGQTSTSTDPTLQATYFTGMNNDTFLITLIATNECGPSTFSQPVIVVPTDAHAQVTTTAAPLFQVCQNEEVCFKSFSLPSGIPLLWDFGDGNTAIGDSVCHAWAAPGTYQVVGRLVSCGFDSTLIEITVLPLPTAAFTSSQPGCPGEEVDFVQNSMGAVGFHWDFGDGDSSSLASPSHVYDSPGNYEVCLTVTSANSCTHDTCHQATVSALPTANFSFPDSICAGDTAFFVNEASADVVACAYDFGDGGNGSADCDPEHVFTLPGNYLVTQTVTNAAGCKDDTSRVLFVRTVPLPGFSFQLLDKCHPAQLPFFNESTNADGYLWDFGDGSPTSTEASPTHVYASPGTFTVTLSAVKDGVCERSVTNQVTILETPAAVIQASATAGCAPFEVSFASTSSGPIDSYAWDFGDGFFDFSQNPTHAYLTPGSYTATLVVGNDECSDTAQVSVTVHPPLLTAHSKVDILCHGEPTGSIDLSVMGGTLPFDYAWSNGAETEDLLGSPAGSYTVTVTDSNGCSSSESVDIAQPDALAFTFTEEQVVPCFGDSEGLICIEPQGGVAPYALTWTNGASGNCQTNVPAGEYPFTVSDANGCLLEASAEVRQNALITLDYFVEHVSCPGRGDGVVHVDSIFGGVLPSFDSLRLQGPAGDLGGGAHYENLPPGIYLLSVSDSLGCLLEMEVEIEERDSIWLDILDSLVRIEMGQAFQMEVAHNTDGPVYTWTPSTGLDCTDCEEPLATPHRSQTYRLDLVDEYGCPLFDTTRIEVAQVRHVVFPNAFTPDDKSLDNDRFFPLSGHPWAIQKIGVFRILSIDGTLVFEAFDIQPNDHLTGWDGSYKGKPAPPAAYTFYAEINYVDGESETAKGIVILIR